MVVLRTDRIKCVVLGDDKVGKTSLLLHYATNRFPGAIVPNVFDNYAGSIELSGKAYNLQLLDTVEKGETEENRRLIYHGADVFLLCFSVVNPQSLQNILGKWLPEVRNYMGDVPFIIVGTQADLRDDSAVVRQLAAMGERPISYREAASISRRLGGACYFECSPVMKKKLRRVMNDAFTSVFCPKEVHFGSTCAIL